MAGDGWGWLGIRQMTISLENEMNEGFKFSCACHSLASAYEPTIL